MNALDRLALLMTRLRDRESGCPWDIEQTLQSLVPHTLEEVYELADSLECNDVEHLKEELGDYLFQAAFYAQIAEENDWFNLHQVIDALVTKLVLRHPHVFPDGELDGVRMVAGEMDLTTIKNSWERSKGESRHRRQQQGTLDDVPRALPAIQRAQKLQKRAASVGFDWSDSSGPQQKLREETQEFAVAVCDDDPEQIEHELGDLLFTCVNLARHHGLDAEQALSRANRRFENRFAQMETQASEQGRTIKDFSLQEFEALWQSAKYRLSR